MNTAVIPSRPDQEYSSIIAPQSGGSDPDATKNQWTLIGFRPLAEELAALLNFRGCKAAAKDILPGASMPKASASPSSVLIVIATDGWASQLSEAAEWVTEVRSGHYRQCCVILSEADDSGQEAVGELQEVCKETGTAWTLLKTGAILGTGGTFTSRIEKWAWGWSALSPSIRIPTLRTEQLAEWLHSAVQRARDEGANCQRIGQQVLWGPRRPLRSILRHRAYHPDSGVARRGGSTLRPLVSAALAILRAASPIFRKATNDIRSPSTMANLSRTIVGTNRRHVRVAGYNNGVVHFGWKCGSRTTVLTRNCRPSAERVNNNGQPDPNGTLVRISAGMTLKSLREQLSAWDRDVPVAPNYSYVTVGTSFYVPIHGTGTKISTLGEAIRRVRLLDTTTGFVYSVGRRHPLFRNCMYSRGKRFVLLSLIFATRQAMTYEKKHEQLESPSADEVFDILRCDQADNTEVRKNRASNNAIDVYRYTATPRSSGQGAQQESPRDALGSLWDRLEENRLTRWVFHTLVRKTAFHVELFMDRTQFRIFWERHGELPISKIQLRYVHRDMMPHSPMCDTERISADLFMTRRKREPFLKFLRECLPNVPLNRGKQSV